MAGFACLAEACPDTCCKGWTIEVDPRTARRYRTHPDPARRAQLTAALVERREPHRSPRTLMRLGSDGCCSLLRSDGLCSVHAELGESWLAEACRTYPRLASDSRTVRYLAGSIGCVEIARRVLFEADAFVETTEGDPTAALARRSADDRATGPALTDGEAAWLRTTVLHLLGRHELPWSARVALLAVTIEDLSHIDLVRGRGPLLELVLRTRALLERPELLAFDRLFPAAHESVATVFVPMLRVLVESGAGDTPIAATACDLTASLRSQLADPHDTLAAAVERSARVGPKVLEPELRARPHLLGNLVGAVLLHEGFPSGRPTAAAEAAWNAACFLGLWKLLTAGALEAGGAFDDVAVRTTYRLGRIFAHWREAKEVLRRDLDKRRARTPALFASLLR